MLATHRNRVLSLSAVVTIVWACVMWTAPHALADPLDGVSDAASDAGEAASDATSDAGDAASGAASDAGDAASGATDEATNAVDEAGEAVADTAGDVADTADEATGGATGDVTDPVEDALNETEEAVEGGLEDVGGAVDGVIDGSTDPGNVLPGGGGSTEPGSGGGSGNNEPATSGEQEGSDGSGASGGHRSRKPNESRQPAGTGASTAGAAPDVLTDPAQHWWTIAVGSQEADRTDKKDHPGIGATQRAGSLSLDVADAFAQVTTQPAAAAIGAVTEAAVSQGDTDGPFAAILKRAAEATRQLAFPLALTMMVVVFLTIQGRFDRKDPKLSLAPVDSEQDTLYFE